ncbi:short-chain dehydrogenase/reductase SDR [Lachnospiraceae bacterium KM106-2]|nr:short-chain dehydrogenase/reductase SDR [Lachnospiraceae bacterium KM106-2]
MKGKVLITGATSGLGLGFATEYASQGYDLIVTGRRKEKIEANMDAIRKKYGVKVKVILVDLSSEEGLTYLLQEIAGEEIQVLINNAGFGLKPCFSDLSEDQLNRMLFLQTAVVTRLTHDVLQQMIQRNEGTIINVSSDSAFAVMPHNVLYASTKTYIMTFTEGLYMELVDTNIKVQVICPGFIDSDFHENAQMKVNKARKGFMKFHSPEEIIAKSKKDLERGRIVCKPSRDVKVIALLSRILPRRWFYKIILSMASKLMHKK